MAQSVLGELLVKITGDNKEYDDSIDRSKRKSKELTKTVSEIQNELNKELNLLNQRKKVFGDNTDYITSKQKLLKNSIDDLIKNGIKVEDQAVKELIKQYKSLDTSRKLKEFGESAKKLGGELTTFVTLPIIALGGAAVKTAMDFEQMQVQLATLLGSADKAKQIFEELKIFAAKTPFELKDLSKSLVTLKSFGIATEELLPTIKTLGDISQGNGEKLSGLTLAFAQMSSTGRLMGQDLLQMINQGFNPLQIISEKTGKSMAQLKKEMEKGAISADMVKDAFKTATSEGGAFFNAMENQSETLAGKFSNLQDSIILLLNEFGNELAPVLKDIVGEVTKAVQSFSELDDGTKKLIIQGALFAAGMGPVIGTIGNITQGLGSVIKIAPTVIASGVKMGAALTAALGPVGIAVAGITIALGAAGIAFGTLIEQIKKEQKETAELLIPATERYELEKYLGRKITNELDQFEAKKRRALSKTQAFKDKLLDAEEEDVEWKIRAARKELEYWEGELKKAQDALTNAGKSTDKTVSSKPVGKSQSQLLWEEVQSNINKEIALLEQRNIIYGDSSNEIADKQKIISDAINKLIDNGFTAESYAIQQLREQYIDLTNVQKVNAELDTKVREEILADIALLKEKEAAFVALTDTYNRYTSLVASSIGPVFNSLGEALVKGEEGWKAFARAGLDAIAGIIDALGTEALVQAAKEVALALESIPNPVLMASHGSAAAAWGVVGATAKVAAGVIRAIPMADGGMIPATPGGVLVQAAEAGSNEYFLPEREDVMNRLADRITASMSRPTANINNNVYNNSPMPSQIKLVVGGKEMNAYITEESGKGNIQIRPRGLAKR